MSDVIVVDNITKEMDLYDAAFLIDYLRDWASKLNRIVTSMILISATTYRSAGVVIFLT